MMTPFNKCCHVNRTIWSLILCCPAPCVVFTSVQRLHAKCYQISVLYTAAVEIVLCTHSAFICTGVNDDKGGGE